jgi:hypothetical protein
MIHLSYVLNCADAPIPSKISDKEQKKLQESQETVDKIGAMERNEEKEKEKWPHFSDVIESYLDPFESMKKATENVVGDNTIVEAVDDDIESLLMLSKMPAVDKSMEKTTDEESNEGKKDEEKGMEEATRQRKKEWKYSPMKNVWKKQPQL